MLWILIKKMCSTLYKSPVSKNPGKKGEGKQGGQDSLPNKVV